MLDYTWVEDINSYTITVRYAGDELEVVISQRDEPMVVTLTGRAEQ